MSERPAQAAMSTPPASFEAFDDEVVIRLGVAVPDPLSGRAHGGRPPSDWPDDKADAEFLHRGLARRLRERGGTIQAALSIRRDLETGRLRAVFSDDGDGSRRAIPPRRWEAAATGADMYLTGRTSMEAREFWGDIYSPEYAEGDIYLISATPEPEVVVAAPVKAKPLDLGDSDELCKLLLHFAGKKSAAIIANNSKGTDYEVAERTVSRLIAKAREQLDKKRK
jgi:hypothetical protein